MKNKNQFGSVLIAKRISYACLAFFVALFIISIISLIFVPFYMKPRGIRGQIATDDYHFRLAYNYFYQVLYPSMVISSITGMIIFTIINRILSNKLKRLSEISSQEILKLNQKLESFKLKRIQEYGYLF